MLAIQLKETIYEYSSQISSLKEQLSIYNIPEAFYEPYLMMPWWFMSKYVKLSLKIYLIILFPFSLRTVIALSFIFFKIFFMNHLETDPFFDQELFWFFFTFSFECWWIFKLEMFILGVLTNKSIVYLFRLWRGWKEF